MVYTFERGRKGFDLEIDFSPIMRGEVTPPNFEQYADTEVGLAAIASGGGLQTVPEVMAFKPPPTAAFPVTYQCWARYFLSTGQGGGLDGDGYVVWYAGGKGKVGRFRLCPHKKIPHPDANPSRGWHPGHCERCGLDMTFDSGD